MLCGKSGFSTASVLSGRGPVSSLGTVRSSSPDSPRFRRKAASMQHNIDESASAAKPKSLCPLRYRRGRRNIPSSWASYTVLDGEIATSSDAMAKAGVLTTSCQIDAVRRAWQQHFEKEKNGRLLMSPAAAVRRRQSPDVGKCHAGALDRRRMDQSIRVMIFCNLHEPITHIFIGRFSTTSQPFAT